MSPGRCMDEEKRRHDLVISTLADLPLFTGARKHGGADERRENVLRIASDVRSCTKCPLHRTRKNAVPGDGSPNAKLMLVGEAPGREEDLAGLPFVGRAGRLLDNALREAGLDRGRVFVTSILKCRPPNNRNPRKAEIETCGPYLAEQVGSIEPNAILAMGNSALLGLLGKRLQVSKVRGQVLRFAGVPVVPTYHPAAILRNPRLKEPFLDDLRKASRRSR